MIEIYLLRQLVELSVYSSLTEAAEHLHVTQPTLTRSIQKLESLIGVKLFRREKNRIYINENGRLAVEYAKRILSCEEEMIAAIQNLEFKRHSISIASCAPAPNMIIKRQLEAMYPGMRVFSTSGQERELLTGLRHGDYQLVVLSYKASEKGLCCQKIGTEHLRLSVLPAHPAAVLDAVSFSDIDSGSYLVYKDLGVWENIGREHMPNARFLYQEGMDDYLEIVGASSLPTFDTDWGVLLYGQRSNRISIPILGDAAQRTFYAVYKTEDREKFDKLIDMIRKSYPMIS